MEAIISDYFNHQLKILFDYPETFKISILDDRIILEPNIKSSLLEDIKASPSLKQQLINLVKTALEKYLGPVQEVYITTKGTDITFIIVQRSTIDDIPALASKLDYYDLLKTIEKLQKIADEHPGKKAEAKMLEYQRTTQLELERNSRLQKLGIPIVLQSAWKSLIDVSMYRSYLNPWNDMAGGGGGYDEFHLTLTFKENDGTSRSFSFHSSESWTMTVHMDTYNYSEFGWAPRIVGGDFKDVSSMWKAQQTGENAGKHICCAISAVIFYVWYRVCYNSPDKKLPWNLKGLLEEIGIADK